jgi:hypothetical protein
MNENHKQMIEKSANYFKPESMIAGNAAGAIIAGIGASFHQLLGLPNGWIMLIAALLFGIVSAVSNRSPSTGIGMLIVYILLGTGIGMWEAAQSGNLIDKQVITVNASQKGEVYVDEDGDYVAVHPSLGEHHCPSWAMDLYRVHLAKEQRSKKSPWSINF